IVKRTTLLCEGDVIEAKVLPFEVMNHGRVMFADEPQELENTQQNGHFDNKASTSDASQTSFNDLKAAAQEAEFDTIMNALRQTNFNKSKAARYLNIDRKTLYNKMRALNI
ncbi:MAG: sigma-54-dependent Fis family transcriptional regulator, partial [Spirosomaceae bacterium]|nr:sigma-54-dependent Fis family transcriptional regulator [Spirosomataceae bacterium]